MKYGNTSRTLSVLFHGILALGGGILAAYFGFFVVPTHFHAPLAFMEITMSLNLKLELAVFGLCLFLISGYGCAQGVLSLIHPSDDKPVVKSFIAFIVMGYVAALFFLLNGVVFFNLTIAPSENPAFIVILGIILCVGLLIAANIPMVKLFEGKDSTNMYKGLAFGFSANAFSITLFSLFALISFFMFGDQTSYGPRLTMLLIYVGFSAAVGVFALLSGLFVGKGPKGISGLFGSLAVLVAGSAFIVIGGLEMGWSDFSMHFTSSVSSNANTLMNLQDGSYAYGIGALVFGIVAFIAGIGCLYINYREKDAKPIANA